ncbi:hypothetical protein GCM10027075_40800 [Streptomyces heilongjiangensis]
MQVSIFRSRAAPRLELDEPPVPTVLLPPEEVEELLSEPPEPPLELEELDEDEPPEQPPPWEPRAPVRAMTAIPKTAMART